MPPVTRAGDGIHGGTDHLRHDEPRDALSLALPEAHPMAKIASWNIQNDVRKYKIH